MPWLLPLITLDPLSLFPLCSPSNRGHIRKIFVAGVRAIRRPSSPFPAAVAPPRVSPLPLPPSRGRAQLLTPVPGFSVPRNPCPEPVCSSPEPARHRQPVGVTRGSAATSHRLHRLRRATPCLDVLFPRPGDLQNVTALEAEPQLHRGSHFPAKLRQPEVTLAPASPDPDPRDQIRPLNRIGTSQ